MHDRAQFHPVRTLLRARTLVVHDPGLSCQFVGHTGRPVIARGEGGGADDDWTTLANWNLSAPGTAVPGTGDTATFSQNNNDTDPCRPRRSVLPCKQLRDALQLNDRQMLPTRHVADRKLELDAASAANTCPRRCTRRTPWPPLARFEPWLAAGRTSAEVDLVGRCPTEEVVRPFPAAPISVERQLS